MERPRVDERDEPALRSGVWLCVDELESALPESGHLLANVLARERKMMESLSPALDEPCDRAVGLEGLEELDMNAPCAEEGHPDALRRHLFREVRLQPEAAQYLLRSGIGFEIDPMVRQAVADREIAQPPRIWGVA